MNINNNIWVIQSVAITKFEDKKAIPSYDKDDYSIWALRETGWKTAYFPNRVKAHEKISENIKAKGGHFLPGITPPKGYEFIVSIYGKISAVRVLNASAKIVRVLNASAKIKAD